MGSSESDRNDLIDFYYKQSVLLKLVNVWDQLILW